MENLSLVTSRLSPPQLGRGYPIWASPLGRVCGSHDWREARTHHHRLDRCCEQTWSVTSSGSNILMNSTLMFVVVDVTFYLGLHKFLGRPYRCNSGQARSDKATMRSLTCGFWVAYLWLVPTTTHILGLCDLGLMVRATHRLYLSADLPVL